MPVAEPGFYTYMGCGIEVESDPNVVREGLFLTPLPTPRRSIPACDQILTVEQHVVGDGVDIMVSLARLQYENVLTILVEADWDCDGSNVSTSATSR